MAERDGDEELSPPDISYDLWDSAGPGPSVAPEVPPWGAPSDLPQPGDLGDVGWPEPVEWPEIEAWLDPPGQWVPPPVEPVEPVEPLFPAVEPVFPELEPVLPEAPVQRRAPPSPYEGMRHLAVLGGLARTAPADQATRVDPIVAGVGPVGGGATSLLGRWRELTPARRAEVGLVGFLGTVAVVVAALAFAGHGGDEIKSTQTLGPRPTVESIASLNLDTSPFTTTSSPAPGETTTTEVPADPGTGSFAPFTAAVGTTPTTRPAARAPAGGGSPAAPSPAPQPAAPAPTAPPPTSPPPTAAPGTSPPGSIERPIWTPPARPTTSLTTPVVPTQPTRPPSSRLPSF